MSQAARHKYQSQTAAVFSDLGGSVSVDAEVAGARAVHRVDVLVQFTRWPRAQPSDQKSDGVLDFALFDDAGVPQLPDQANLELGLHGEIVGLV